LRTRRIAGQVAADVHIIVNPRISVSEGHIIGQTVIDRLIENVDLIHDVTVHIDPEDDEVAAPSKGLPLRLEAEQQLEQAISIVDGYTKPEQIVLHYLAGKIDVDLYFSLGENSTSERTAELKGKLQRSIDPLPFFGEIRVYFS